MIYIHKTCASSYRLYRELRENNLLEHITLKNVAKPLDDRGRLIWSVPWGLAGDEVFGGDPMPRELVEAALQGGEVPAGDPIESFMEAVIHSSLASSLALLYGSLEPVLDEDLAAAAVHAPLSGADPNAVLVEVAEKSREIYSEWSPKMVRALAMGFVREAWWSAGGSLTHESLARLVEAGGFRAWLIGKGSLGRVGLPSDPREIASRDEVRSAEDFILKTARVLVRRVEAEQKEILGDEEWMSL